MSVIGTPIPPVASVGGDGEILDARKPADGLAGYRKSMFIEDSVQMSATCINLNVRAKIWMPRDLYIPPNLELSYAICPIAIASH